MLQDLPGEVVVAQVGGGKSTQGPNQLDRQIDRFGQGRSVRVQQLGEDVPPVDPDGPFPREVVQPHMLQLDALRRDVEEPGDAALEPDPDVAQPDGPMPVVEQGLSDDPGRVGEVDDPGARSGPLRHLFGQVQHHRDRPQGLGEPSRARGLLADAAEHQGHGLVDQPGPLAPHPELHHDEVGAIEGPVPVAGGDEFSPPADPPEDPPGQAAHHVQTLGVDVQEGELVDGDPVGAGTEPFDQLGRVGAPRPHNRHLHTHGRSILYSGP